MSTSTPSRTAPHPLRPGLRPNLRPSLRRGSRPSARRLRPGADVVVPLVAAGILATVYTVLALRQHEMLMTSGYDLGIFVQEVRSYALGHLPVSTLKGPGFQLLGDHFSPAVAVLAPFYRLFPCAQTLLVAQALLLALGVMPLTAWAHRCCGIWTAIAVAVVYGLSWELAEAVGFDFHEVALAVPLLAWSLSALGQDRLTAAVWYAVPLVLVKEDLGLTVAVIGALVAWRGNRILGAAAALGGVTATLVETFVVIPAYNASGTNPYSGQISIGAGPWHQLAGVLGSEPKLSTLFLLVAPTAFLALRSPLCLVAVPTLTWRFLADNPAYWGTGYHYSAVLAPVAVAAMVDALSRRPPGARWLPCSVAVAVTVVLVGSHPLSRLWQPSLWEESPRVAAAHRLLARIPDDATVSASNWLAPQLTSRDDVSLFAGTDLDRPRPEWIVVDTGSPLTFPIGPAEQIRALDAARRDGYRLLAEDQGVYLLRAAP
ncbi:DUF2079 domain-containing protein [Nocardioides acrostichi]|uniref:DUF2079 domain-containing protein n=1 Tax=Nocardioides acrostichi TaxID=2784339 RepID=A0A930V0H7_9ACTN|nr:DUF2079 domain-containing protein [Nocardioides acrostichi]MBF4160984.1 DUF2079 domain-containing protein [Nocardioides acrostichi]